MARKNLKNFFSVSILILSILAGAGFVLLFTTCDSPMGLGKPIDFDPPVLTLDESFVNPIYVRKGAELFGTVTDNIAVDRVILREAGTTNELFKATVEGIKWHMPLLFTEEDNGEKKSYEIVAFDKMGNSGDVSIKAVTLIIDMGDPIVEDLWIQRTLLKRTYFESLSELKKLQNLLDTKGEKREYINQYQNGYFYIEGKISEEQTRIEPGVTLEIYDSEDLDTVLISIPLEEERSLYSPRWLISEEDIILAGETRWPGYDREYYVDKQRKYYRVFVKAIDMANNEAKMDEGGFFCMWAKADEPKGILDPNFETEVSIGTPLPVEIFDDDALSWAYTGLLTKDQWNGVKQIYSGVYISNTLDDEGKLKFLKDRFLESQPVYNWKYDKYTTPNNIEQITDQVAGKDIDEKLVYVPTGNQEHDYGDYILFTIVGDKKIDPNKTGSRDTQKNIDTARAYHIEIIDENAPLIVLDTVRTQDDPATGYIYYPTQHTGSNLNETVTNARTGDSPEENTFPKLTDNSWFEINGYTLREDRSGFNSVTKFRIAWIPAGISGGPDAAISRVQEQLESDNPAFTNENGLAGVQWWNFTTGLGGPNTTHLVQGGEKEVVGDGGLFRKQAFRKRFNVLGGQDNIKPEYKNFHYGCNPLGCANDGPCRENKVKLFIIYAEDNMGHIVFRQLRLLPSTTPPDLVVYDITDELYSNQMPETPNKIPNINDYAGIAGDAYYTALNAYNNESGSAGSYNIIKNAFTTGGANIKPAVPFMIYPRDTIIKFWINASRSGDLALQSLRMFEITDTPNRQVGSYQLFNPSGDRAISFCEFYPDETNRQFLIEATDTLGNVARLQRTVAISNAARLDSITTSHQDGTYGMYGAKKNNAITLVANFSRNVSITPGSGGIRPELNIRYKIVAGKDIPSGAERRGDYVHQSIQCEPVTASEGTMKLEFKFQVPEWAEGKIETMYDAINMGGKELEEDERPIKLRAGAKIIDVLRGQEAFIPGYTTNKTTMPKWITNEGSLQLTSTINLDGIRPVITGSAVSGKTAYNPDVYYFKTGETINITLSSGVGGKTIKPSSVNPTLQYYIKSVSNNAYVLRGPFTAAFVYNRPSGNDLMFSLPVTVLNATIGGSHYDGQLVDVTLHTNVGDIEDNVGNSALFNGALADELIPANTKIYIKQNIPAAPAATLTTQNPTLVEQLSAVTADAKYNKTPTLTVPASSSQYGITGDLIPWEDTVQYSTTGDLGWGPYTAPVELTNGTYTLQARYIDRAGNTGTPVSKKIQVNANFPKLIKVGSLDAHTWYRAGNNLRFVLDFDNQVRVNQQLFARKDNAATNTFTNRNAANTADLAHDLGTNNTVIPNVYHTSADGTVTPYFLRILSATTFRLYDTQTAANAAGNGLALGAGNQGTINLNVGAVTIKLTNRKNPNSNNTGGTNPSYEITLQAAPGQTTLRSSIQFNWTNISGKEMPDGLFISDVNITGLRDSFSNAGGTGTAAISTGGVVDDISMIGTTPTHDCKNLTAGLRVDAIAPRVNLRTPLSGETLTSTANGSSGSATYNRVITLTFNEPVMKGVGTITVRPRGEYAIPAVFENDGYYLQSNSDGTTTRATSSGQNRTYIPSLYDVYNNSALTAANRVALLRSTTAASQGASVTGATAPSSVEDTATPSMSRLLINARTGRNTGPYILMTHGLISGPGYTGNYTQTGNATDGTGANAPNPAGTFMVPDTVSKWVLDYQFGINQDVAAVNNIRTALTAAKYRWQEVDVVNSNVVISGSTVTITLNEPLLHGLQWDVAYPEGTFTDMAGNNAALENSYWLWSNGVQTPVVRVNRRSYDGRTSEWHRSRGASNNYTFANPTDSTDWGADTAVGDAATNAGWGIANFNTIHYRVDCESPGAALTVGTHKGTSNTSATGANARGSASAAWTGSVLAANANATDINGAYEWGRAAENVAGTWALNNLIRRSRNNADTSYSVNTKSGLPEVRTYEGTYRGYRSYNRDYNLTNLEGITLASVTLNSRGGHQNVLTYEALEANKSYVAAQASLTRTGSGVTNSSNKGYEGIFRTVIAFNFGTGLSENQLFVQGSNVKNGMPSVSGFPVRDAEETGDNRFIKMFFRNTTGNTQFYWVSTEIVCEWYLISWGGGGTHQNVGEANNYSTVGYGDLTYGYNVTRYGR